jgi:RNA polymerase sigma-54 factor
MMNQKRPDVKKAVHLLRNYFDDLRSGNLQKIKKNLELEDEEVKIILKLLASLHTKPVVENSDSVNARKTIIPDFIVTGEKGSFHVSLYRQRSSDLAINKGHVYSPKEPGEGPNKDVQRYLRNKLSSAQWFIYAIRERERNMLRIMREIVKFQEDYFQEGDIRCLKPMVLKNIAEKVNLDISAVSRITCNKYAETDFGIIALKDLFTEGITNEDGLSVSNKVIKSIIKEIIETENKETPYTDQQLTRILATKGCSVARRTVAKYREQLQIPGAHRRGVWAAIL